MTKEELIEVASFCHDKARLINQDLYIVRQILKLSIKYEEEINISPAFYTMILDSLGKSIMIELAKLYDNDGKSIQIAELMRQICANMEYFPKTKRIDIPGGDIVKVEKNKIVLNKENLVFDIPIDPENAFGELSRRRRNQKQKIERLRQLRNQVYAHNDRILLLNNQVNNINGLSLDDLEDLVLLAFDVSDFVIIRLTGAYRTRKAINIDDLENTLKFVKMGRGYWKQEIQKN